MSFLIAALVAVGFACPSSARTPDLEGAAAEAERITKEARQLGASRSFVLKILSYNIKGTPVAPFQGFSHDRYKKIGKILARRRASGTQPHLVLIQEAFVSKTKELREHAGYPHLAKGPGTGGAALDGGLYILSDYPIADKEVVAFGADACSGWDCHANKGAMLARLQIPGLPFAIDVYNAHLQAGADAEEERLAQIDILERFLRQNMGVGNPSIFPGDFNTKPRRPSYGYLLQKTGLANAGADCRSAPASCAVSAATDPLQLLENTHDQHLYAPGKQDVYRIRPVFAERNFQDEEALSDHLGYEVHYEIRWQAPSP